MMKQRVSNPCKRGQPTASVAVVVVSSLVTFCVSSMNFPGISPTVCVITYLFTIFLSL